MSIEITEDDSARITIEADAGELPPTLDVPTWLVLSGVSGQALKLAHLITLLHRQPPQDRELTLRVFAALLGVRKIETVAEYVSELESVGWLTVDRRRVSGWQVANRYRYRYTPPTGHVTPRTVDDLMAVVDARQSKPVDTRKSPGRAVPRKNGVRTPLERGTENAVAQKPRSRRTPEKRGTDPAGTGSYKELSYSSSSSIDRSIEEALLSKEDEPSQEARDLVRLLDYGRRPPPSLEDVDRVARLVDAAVSSGRVTWAEARDIAQAAVGRARTSVIPYLAGAFASDRLPAPRPESPRIPPPCGQCDGRPDEPVSTRLVWLDDSTSEPCPRCHPAALAGQSRSTARKRP